MSTIKISEQCSQPFCRMKADKVYAGEEFGILPVRSEWFQPMCKLHASEAHGHRGVTREHALGILAFVRKHPKDSTWPYSIQTFAYGAVAYIQPQGWETAIWRDRRGEERTVYCVLCGDDCEMDEAVRQGWAFPVWGVDGLIASEEVCPVCTLKYVRSLVRAFGDKNRMAEFRLHAVGFDSVEHARHWLADNRDVDLWDEQEHSISAERYTTAPWRGLGEAK